LVVHIIGGCATDDLRLRYGGGVAGLLINDSGTTMTARLRRFGSTEDER
jgi:hypothetical protein